MNGAQGGNRTHKPFGGHQILSLARIPIPPLVHMVRPGRLELPTPALKVRCSPN